MCFDPEECVDHLFVHWYRVSSLWYPSFVDGGGWVQPSNVKDVLVAWRRRLKSSWVLRLWKLVDLAIWWCT